MNTHAAKPTREDTEIERRIEAYLDGTACAHCGRPTLDACKHGVCPECHKEKKCLGCGGK